MRRLVLALLLAAVAAAPATAQTVTLTFDELPTQPVDGLTVKGVTFDFKVLGTDSLDARYGALGPGTTPLIQDPSLEGDALGILTLDFAQPVSHLSFGVALLTGLTLTPGCTVDLYDESLAFLGTASANMAPFMFFTEGSLSAAGGPYSRAVVDFHDAGFRFALDNLTYVVAVPEPGPVALLAGFAAAGLHFARRRRGR